MKKFTLAIIACALCCHQVLGQDFIRGFIQSNLVGLPVIHEKQTWIFDPDISLRRRKQYIDLHGDKGNRLIERLGLGIDGYEEERLAKQRLRDEGHLGGLNQYLP